jgi:uncharacterized protein GlcG (DUF336 family)
MNRKQKFVSKFARVAIASALALAGTGAAFADNGCASLPDNATLKSAIVAAAAAEKSGLNNHMWATIVDRDGVVCAVAFSGTSRSAQWPGSRIISAQKASTANAFSLDATSNSNGSGQPGGLALSTANLYSAVQPGGSLYGLQASNPVDPAAAYKGDSVNYGTVSDPIVGTKVGGVNVFGGGLPLYATGHILVGAVGVSGDTSCADHNIGWRVRNILGFDHMAAGNLPAVGGVSGDPLRPDNIVFDITGGASAGGFGHPSCLNTAGSDDLPAVKP